MTSTSTTIFPCNTCSIAFESNELQRSHMRQSWHICNLRRRVAELPAITESEYSAQVQSKEQRTVAVPSTEQISKQTAPAPSSTPKSDPEDQPIEKIPSTQCLFCNLLSPDMEANIKHMSSIHSLFIPSPEHLSDLESLLGYLAVIIFVYHECLYCGLEKGSLDGVQTHMRDKGHCMIKVDAESELLDFWNLSDEDHSSDEDRHLQSSYSAIRISETEMKLPSGAVINPRSDATQAYAKSRTRALQYRARRAEFQAVTASAEDQEEQLSGSRPLPPRDQERRLAIRGEMGLTGVSDAQRRALQVTEQKMKRREALAKAAQRHAIEQQPVKTIYYKTENPVYQAG